MPKIAVDLTALEIKNLKHTKPGKNTQTVIAVGHVSGLCVRVSPSDVKSWLLRYRYGGKAQTLSFGNLAQTSLVEAKKLAKSALAKVELGVDPKAEKIEAKAKAKASVSADTMTFRECYEQVVTIKTAMSKNAKHKQQWENAVPTHIYPYFGDRDINEITIEDVCEALESIWYTKTETADRIRSRLEATFAWANVRGYREKQNPAVWKNYLDTLLPSPGKLKKVTPNPAVQVEHVQQWYVDVFEFGGIGTNALLFQAHTAARPGEVFRAKYAEIDFDKAIWTRRAENMKTGREHSIPLTDAALKLVMTAARPASCDLLFPSPKGTMLSENTFAKAMRRVNKGADGRYIDKRTQKVAVPHGLRSTFKDWAIEETAYPNELSEIALSHNVGDAVMRAYLRSDMIAKRRDMMNDWSTYLTSLVPAKV